MNVRHMLDLCQIHTSDAQARRVLPSIEATPVFLQLWPKRTTFEERWSSGCYDGVLNAL